MSDYAPAFREGAFSESRLQNPAYATPERQGSPPSGGIVTGAARQLLARWMPQDLELRVYYGFGAECLRMHPEDARMLDAATVCGMEIYVDAEMVPGEPEIVSSEVAKRRYGAP